MLLPPLSSLGDPKKLLRRSQRHGLALGAGGRRTNPFCKAKWGVKGGDRPAELCLL